VNTTEDTETVAYFDQVIGATITAVHDDAESMWIHLSDGSVIEIVALTDGGFDVEVHPAETSH